MWGGGARVMLPVIYICLQELKCVFKCVVWYVVCGVVCVHGCVCVCVSVCGVLAENHIVHHL